MFKKPWGYHLVLDLQRCNFNKITDAKYIYEFIIKICDHIGMTRHGEPLLDRFGIDEGYSFCQLIKESNISAHFIEGICGACIDIFSCKEFDKNKAIDFCVDYFEADDYTCKFIKRG